MEVEESAVAYYPKMDTEAYLKWERMQELKHEYLEGKIIDISGGTLTHSRIISNLLIAIGSFLKDTACSVFASDLRVSVKSKILISILI